jgi:hypothetical protein
MQPITRETVVDRRQPAIRWSAVLGGTAVALGLWGVLQVLGIGAGLAALDPDDASSARGAALGTGVWSMIAPLIAMFVGGFVAAKLSNTYDRRVAASHATVMWGVAATAGLVFTMWMAAHAAFGAARHGDYMGGGMGRHDMMMQPGIVSDAHSEARDALTPINNRLKLQGKPQIMPDQLVAAVRGAIDDGELDHEDLVKGLAEKSALSKDEAAAVVTELGPRADIIATHAARPTPMEHAAMNAAETAGKGLFALGIAIILGIGTSILGAMLAMRRNRTDDDRRDREIRTGEVVTTPPYPPVTPTAPDV